MIVRPSLKNKRNLLFGNLIKSLALVSYNLDNKDGFGVLMENNITHRTLDFEEYLKVLKGIKPQKIVMHLRKATVGKVCQRNIHLWNEDGFIIAHNGSVGGFYYDMEKKETDSLLFFRKYKDLFKEIFLSKDEKLIEKLISKVKEEILKGVYYVRDTYNELEMILSTDKFYIGKISFSLFRESYFILSSKKDVLEDLKEKGGFKKAFKKKWLFYKFKEEKYVVDNLLKKAEISIKELKNGFYMFTQKYPEELICFKKIKKYNYLGYYY
jgi:predicted glutamine amidotransferase